jgi:drug/metabolite transporter (DMT)-like permease
MNDLLKLHLVILAWGLTAILGKLIHLPPVQMLLWRTSFAAIGFAIVARLVGQSLPLPGKQIRTLLLLGGLLGVHWILFFVSARLSTASVSLAAMPTAMLWCSLIEPWMDGTRRWRPLELVVGVVMVAAVFLIYQVEFRHWQGFSVALAAAGLAAVFAVMSKQLVSRCHFAVMGTWQMTGAFIACIPSCLWFERGHLVLPSLADFALLLLLASLCTVWAYAGYMDVLRRLPMFTVNVIYNLEPIYGIILAILVFGAEEHMRFGFYLGSSLIISSVVILPWLEKWTGQRH